MDFWIVGNSRLINVTDFLTVHVVILSVIFVSLFDSIAPSCYIFFFIEHALLCWAFLWCACASINWLVYVSCCLCYVVSLYKSSFAMITFIWYTLYSWVTTGVIRFCNCFVGIQKLMRLKRLSDFNRYS